MKLLWVKFSAIIVSGLVTAGCGGGGGEAPADVFGGGGGSFGRETNTNMPTTPFTPVTAAEGLYNGTTSTGRTITGLVLDDGTYYVLYSSTSNPTSIAGAVQGTGTSTNGTFASTDAKDINLEGAGITDATVSASYVPKQSFNGSITSASNQSVTFTSTYNIDYELTPTLAALAGTYTGAAGSPAGAEDATLTVTTGGTITGTGASGCTLTGTVTPRAKGNAYDTTITFGGAPCLVANTTVSGSIYFDAARKQAYAVALTADRAKGVIYLGAKP